MTKSELKPIADELTKLFPKSEQPVYSLGFQRLEKLTAKKRKLCFIALYFEGFTNCSENQEELKKRLAAMTEQDFQQFKNYYIQYNIGKAKYVINYHDGISKHKDGGDFYGIKIFKNKKSLKDAENQLIKDGYKEKSII